HVGGHQRNDDDRGEYRNMRCDREWHRIPFLGANLDRRIHHVAKHFTRHDSSLLPVCFARPHVGTPCENANYSQTQKPVSTKLLHVSLTPETRKRPRPGFAFSGRSELFKDGSEPRRGTGEITHGRFGCASYRTSATRTPPSRAETEPRTNGSRAHRTA